MKNKVLIVDDALIMRRILRDMLELNEYEVIGEASDKNEAVEQYKMLKPDVVFMDIVLDPDIPFGGIEAIKEILIFDPQAKIVIVSAVDQKKLLNEAFQLGIKQYVGKPFSEERIINALKDVVEE